LDFAALQRHEKAYKPNGIILKALADKTLVCAVGPAGVGKSTTLDIVSRLDSDFGRTGSVVTRPPHERDDPALYRYVSPEEATRLIAEGELVNYIVHPTTHQIYGSDLTAFAYPYNMLEALPESLGYFQKIGFKQLHVLYFVSEPSAWRSWFEQRYPDKTDEYQKRLQEAEISLQWALRQGPREVAFIYNAPGSQEETAKNFIGIVKYNVQQRSDGITYAKGMLQQIGEMK